MRSADVGVRPLLYALLVDVERLKTVRAVSRTDVVHTMYSSAPALQRAIISSTLFFGSVVSRRSACSRDCREGGGRQHLRIARMKDIISQKRRQRPFIATFGMHQRWN